MKIEILTIFGILVLASIIGIHKREKMEEEKYCNEIFYEPSSNYIVLKSDVNRLKCLSFIFYKRRICRKFNKFLFVMVYYHNEIEHPSDGWTFTSEPEEIVKCKISDDGKKLLLAGLKPGFTEIHISHSEAYFGKVIKVMVTTEKADDRVEKLTE